MDAACKKAVFWALTGFIFAAALFIAFVWPLFGVPLLLVLTLTFCLIVLLMPDFWDTVRPRRERKPSGKNDDAKHRGFQPNMMLESCVTTDMPPIIITKPTFTIGRGPDNDYILDMPSISTHHCRIIYHELRRHYYIEDLGSTNGTFVNASRLHKNTPILLKANSIVGLNQQRFTFRSTEPLRTH
ncbi:MAG: FHA domain-containing protein [Christensenellaceae bacterium]|nr:FHA domain-containing protein [Christensenellaceae bacterium]